MHHTLAQMLQALNAPRGARVVMDRGIATEDRVQWLRDNGYRYVVVSRERTRCCFARNFVTDFSDCS